MNSLISSFPEEIICHIASFLALSNADLRSFSEIGRAYVEPGRALLFEGCHALVDADHTLADFEDLLTRNRNIAGYIKTLQLEIRHNAESHEHPISLTIIAAILARLPHIDTLFLIGTTWKEEESAARVTFVHPRLDRLMIYQMVADQPNDKPLALLRLAVRWQLVHIADLDKLPEERGGIARPVPVSAVALSWYTNTGAWDPDVNEVRSAMRDVKHLVVTDCSDEETGAVGVFLRACSYTLRKLSLSLSDSRPGEWSSPGILTKKLIERTAVLDQERWREAFAHLPLCTSLRTLEITLHNRSALITDRERIPCPDNGQVAVMCSLMRALPTSVVCIDIRLSIREGTRYSSLRNAFKASLYWTRLAGLIEAKQHILGVALTTLFPKEPEEDVEYIWTKLEEVFICETLPSFRPVRGE